MFKFGRNNFVNEKGLVVSKRMSFIDGNFFIAVICALGLIVSILTSFRAASSDLPGNFYLFLSMVFVMFLCSLGSIKNESFYERVDVKESFAFVSESSYYLNSKLPEGVKVSESKLSELASNPLSNGQYVVVSDSERLTTDSLIVIKELGFAAALATVGLDLSSAREVDYVVSRSNSLDSSSFSVPSNSLRLYDLSKFTRVRFN